MRWRPTTNEVLPKSFGEIVSNHQLIVFHFWASWNAYDRHMDAALATLQYEYEGRIFFGSVDADNQENWQLCRELGVVNLPALAFFANGKHLETVIGMRPKENLSQKMEKWTIASRA